MLNPQPVLLRACFIKFMVQVFRAPDDPLEGHDRNAFLQLTWSSQIATDFFVILEKRSVYVIDEVYVGLQSLVVIFSESVEVVELLLKVHDLPVLELFEERSCCP